MNYGRTAQALNGVTLSLSNDSTSSSSLASAYTDWGTKMSIADGQTAEWWIPDARPNISFLVSGESTTSTVTGGEEITVKEGETGTFTTGTTVTVKDVTYTATVTDGSTVVTNGTGFTYMTPAPLNGKAQVYTDAQSVPGPKIVVGGPAVNALATEVADLLNPRDNAEYTQHHCGRIHRSRHRYRCPRAISAWTPHKYINTRKGFDPSSIFFF